MKYNIIFPFLLFTLLFSSCGNSWLNDIEPRNGTETDIVIKNNKDAQYALNGIYYTFRQYEYYGARFTYYADVKGDDMQAYSSTKRSGKRRKEFVGEGHRMFDMLRNNKRIERTGSSHLKALTDDAKSFDWNYYKIVMPIPKSEMDANPNMIQNPNY